VKRLKKILKWTGVVLGGLVAILLVANAWFVWTTDIRLERQLEEIRKAGDPLSLAELARPPIPPEKNAATFLRRAEADTAAIEKKTMNLREAWGGWYGLPPEEQKAVEAVFAAHPKVIPLLAQAAACPDYDAQLDYTLPPQEFNAQLLDVLINFRSVARVLHSQAKLLMAEGKPDEAVRTALMIFRLSRHFEHSPTLSSYLSALAVRGAAIGCANLVLQSAPVSKEVRDTLDAELALQEHRGGHVWALKSDRAMALDFFRAQPRRNFWLYSRGIWNQRESDYLDMFQTILTMAHTISSYRQVRHAIDTIPWKAWRTSDIPNASFGALVSNYVPITRTWAMVRCLRVLNALQTRVPTGSDEVPKLSELGLPAETVTDPFTDEPLHVKNTPQGWLVYSVGMNLQDDGGKLDEPETGDVGVGPPPPAANTDEK